MRDSLEAHALQEICAATRKVGEDMAQLRSEPWAAPLVEGRPATAPPGASTGAGSKRAAEEVGASARDRGVEKPISEAPGEATGAAANAGATAPILDGLPDLQEFLARLDDNFKEADIKRMQRAFQRFKVPDSNDLHSGDVCGLLQYLGHVMTAEEGVRALVKEVTAYDYLDFDEFLSLMERFVPYEKQQFRVMFERYDEDRNGRISVAELKPLLADLGFIPLHAMLVEALSVVDTDGAGDLDFDEFVLFLAVYRRAEGFARHDVADLRRVFDCYSREGEAPKQLLPAGRLADALVQVFGVHVSEFSEQLEGQLRSGQGFRNSSYSAASAAHAESLTFPEFLIFARKTREASLEKLRRDHPAFAGKSHGEAASEFARNDADSSGGISEEELRGVLKGLGYTPLKQSIQEVFAVVDKDRSKELDFNEFFDFMLLFRQREGFTQQAIDEMRRTFNRFDKDASGEISALELADLFRELGYQCTLDEIHTLVTKVDSNGSNQLDFREFLCLMRVHREDELRNLGGVFKDQQDHRTLLLPAGALERAMGQLGLELSVAALRGQPEALDFEDFVGFADRCRAERLQRERKKAGFCDERVVDFRELFQRFDKDRSGAIDKTELLDILKEFNWEPKSRQEQQALMNKLEAARARARDAGIEDTDATGPSAITFWTFVQLARILETEQEQAEEERMALLAEELKFSQREVEEFRQIFFERRRACARDLALATEPEGLARDAVRRLVRALGITVQGERRAALDAELEALGCRGEELLGFAGFLRLMRWLMASGWLGGD